MKRITIRTDWVGATGARRRARGRRLDDTGVDSVQRCGRLSLVLDCGGISTEGSTGRAVGTRFGPAGTTSGLSGFVLVFG